MCGFNYMCSVEVWLHNTSSAWLVLSYFVMSHYLLGFITIMCPGWTKRPSVIVACACKLTCRLPDNSPRGAFRCLIRLSDNTTIIIQVWTANSFPFCNLAALSEILRVPILLLPVGHANKNSISRINWEWNALESDYSLCTGIIWQSIPYRSLWNFNLAIMKQH